MLNVSKQTKRHDNYYLLQTKKKTKCPTKIILRALQVRLFVICLLK